MRVSDRRYAPARTGDAAIIIVRQRELTGAELECQAKVPPMDAQVL